MTKKINKQIDLNQLPHNKRGYISWKDSVGMTINFFYYEEKHTITIIDYGNPDDMHITIQIDDMPSETVYIDKVRKLMFDHLFVKPNYYYNIGDTVNGVIILEQCLKRVTDNKEVRGFSNRKAYRVKCIEDKYEYVASEYELRNGCGCPVCSGNIIVRGINDLATTNPEVIKYLDNKEDAYVYSRGSGKYVWVKCIFCGYKKQIKVNDLAKLGYFGCQRCSDGLSYCNKFAHELFSQLEGQYSYYNIEYTPDWAGRFRYDNYIELYNGKKMFVEMDGHFHYRNNEVKTIENDKLKNKLAMEHDIEMIRIDCNYPDCSSRHKYIRDNVVKMLSQFFDLSNINWDKCNNAGLSNKLIEVVEYYNQYEYASISQMANVFNCAKSTIRKYLTVGNELGLCDYIRLDPKRNTRIIHLAVYDLSENLVGSFWSAEEFANKFNDEGIKRSSVNSHSRTGKPYKGYIIKPITLNEYEALQKMYSK